MLLAVLLIGAMTIAMSGTALAVHDEQFQLDIGVNGANTVDDAASAQPFDWENFFNATGTGGTIAKSVNLPDAGFPGFTASGGTADFALPDATTYTTGSKDTLGISGGWQCTRSNNVGDKVDIVNAYALAYVRPADNHLILYYGVEKSSPLGNSNIATWFLKDGTVNCSSPGGSTNFTRASAQVTLKYPDPWGPLVLIALGVVLATAFKALADRDTYNLPHWLRQRKNILALQYGIVAVALVYAAFLRSPDWGTNGLLDAGALFGAAFSAHLAGLTAHQAAGEKLGKAAAREKAGEPVGEKVGEPAA